MLPSRPSLPGSRCLLPGPVALTAPARPVFARRRQRSCRGRSAAEPPSQLGPSTGPLAPPIVKGPAGGSAYKASAGARAAPRCQSRLAIQRGRPAPANRRPGRARCDFGSAAPARPERRTRAARLCRRWSLAAPAATHLQRAFLDGSRAQAKKVATPRPCA